MEGRARRRFEMLNKGPRWREDRRNDRSPPGRTGVSLECPAEGIHLLTLPELARGMGRAVMEFTAAREEIERADSLWLKPAPEVKLPDGFFDPNISKTTRRITNISGPARLKILAIIVFIGVG